MLAAMTCAASLSVYAAYETDARKPPQGKAPPQAAIDACKGLTEKDSCQFTEPDNPEVAGTCFLAPQHSEMTVLACRPNQHPKDFSKISE
ncbi:MAG: hypothetical protein EOO52_19140 [Gammaproteobacteria bacterium]|nr:MAG: hypothetical protein EOO52_19140 [Gammaproteobacteria bacterium]